MRLVDPVQHQIRERDRVDEVLLLAAVEGAVLECFNLIARRVLAQGAAHELISLGQETARAAAGIADRLAHLRGHGLHDGADDLPRGEELPAVVALLAHLEQQSLVNLAQGEDVRVIHRVEADLVDLVQRVQ